MKEHESTRLMPVISAIVRASDGLDAIRPSLESLRAQSLDADRFEVVVVDDDCPDEAWAAIEAAAADLSFRFAHRETGEGTGWRNRGLSLARSSIVLFLEPCEMLDPACLAGHCLGHAVRPQPEVAVLGYTALGGEAERSPLMRYLVEVDPWSVDGEWSKDPRVVGEFGCCDRSLSFKRPYLLDHGGFNPVFPLGTESRELVFRLSRAGLQVVRSAGATSVVTRPLDFDDVCTRYDSQGQADWLLAEQYPERDISGYANLDGVQSEWKAIAPLFPNVMKSARELDRFARERCRADLPVDGLTTRLLHRAYAAALRANRIRGVMHAMSEQDFDSTPLASRCTEG